MARKQTAADCERLQKYHERKADHYKRKRRELSQEEGRVGFRYDIGTKRYDLA